jgi:hypothetical protein
MERIDSLISSGRILRDEPNRIVSLIKWGDREMVVSRFNPQGFFHSLRNTILSSPAQRSWENGYQSNNKSPRPLAYIERRKSGLVWKSYFVTENISAVGKGDGETSPLGGEELS